MRIDKIKSASIDELRTRGAQAYSALLERLACSDLTRFPTTEEIFRLFSKNGTVLKSSERLLESFKARNEAAFFTAFVNKAATLEQLRTRWPWVEAEIIRSADRVSQGKFDLLGLRSLVFGQPVDWHLEPISGKRSPFIHWSRLNFLDADIAGDKKIIWELNRHQYFGLLGEAYWLSGDEKYAQTFVEHLAAWMASNPPKVGINWASSLEIAFRSISWLWALQFFNESASLSGEILLKVLKFLYLNGRHLETYLSTYFSPNTHLTGEALGLFYLGILLPEFKEAERWRNIGRKVLNDELERHVKADGVYFEQSSYYHRYTTDFYLHFMILSQLNGDSVPEEVLSKLQALLEHMMLIMRPDGTTPFFGDDDGGRLVKLDRRRANDFRATLSTGAVIFRRPDFKFAAGEAAEETLWLLGAEALHAFDSFPVAEPNRQSAAFESGGYYVMRDGWSSEANYLLFDSGPHGWANCGHAHADSLSFELAAHGHSWLIDPGTFTYTGSREERNWFRSSMAHNTVTVDYESSSEPAGPFSWESIGRSETLAWISNEHFDYVKGRQDGYLRLPEPVSHTRSILFPKKEYWLMRDEVSGAGRHQYDLWFHFDADANPTLDEVADRSAIIAYNDKSALKIAVLSTNGNWKRDEGHVSPCYGMKLPAPVYVFSALGDTQEFMTFLLPSAGRDAPMPSVNEIAAKGGRAFEIVNRHTRDVVMINHEDCVQMENLTSDFDWCWARFVNGSADPEELILINGRDFQVNGKSCLRLDQDLPSIFMHRVDGLLQVK